MSDGVRHLTTARLVLRPIDLADFAFAAELYARQDMTIHRPDPTPDTTEVTAGRLAKDVAHWATHGFGKWALFHEGHPAGFGGLSARDGWEGLNVSFHLHPALWGRGLIAELMQAIRAAGFGPLAAPRLYGLARATNLPSRRVLERARYTHEGEAMLDGSRFELYTARRT